MSDENRRKKPPAVKATEYLIELDRRHEAERVALESRLTRKYAEHAAAVLRKIGVSQSIPRSSSHPALAAVGIVLTRFPARAQWKLLEGLPANVRRQILAGLLNLDSLFRLDRLSLQHALRRIPRDILARALVGADEERLALVFANVSSGAESVFRDELEYAAQTSTDDAGEAAERVGEVMRELYEAGEIPLPSSSAEGEVQQ